MDKTDYARALGYSGIKSVLVRDGRVISHRGVRWDKFCDDCRKGKR